MGWKRGSILVSAVVLAGCGRDVADPFALAPSTPFSTWSPMRGNNLVSSKYCQTLLPDTFGAGEMNLAELIDIALQNNPSTKQTWAEARAAAAQYGVSLSSFYPNIEFDASFVRARSSSSLFSTGSASSASSSSSSTFGGGIGGQSDKPFYSTQTGPDVTLSYTLFDFGQRSSAALAAREALYYADLTHNQEIQTIIQTVMDDYYNYLYQMAQLRANEANLENAQMSLDAANERFALGLAALGDVAQARTTFLQNRINLTTQKQNVEDAFAQMATDLGLPASLRFKVQPMPEQVAADPLLESVDALVCRAQEQRQDFLAAQANLRSKEASLLNAQRATLPVLDSNFDIGHYWYQKGGQEKGAHWSATFALTFPIFDGFYYRNQIKNAQANVELAKAQLLQTELSVVQNVATSHMGVKTAALNLSDSYEYLKAAELEFNIALANYKAGTGTILDVISAQSSLADARSKKAQAQQNWFTSLASLAYATGSLCSTPNEESCENR
jgi:outer membrane protein TolC